MESVDVYFGATAALFIGATEEQDPITKLQQISNERSGGSRFLYDVPETFEVALGNYAQAGNAKVLVELNFLELNSITDNLSSGKLPDADPDDPPAYTQFSILMLHPSDEGTEHVYVPVCVAKKGIERVYLKDGTLGHRISFNFEDPSIFTQLYVKGNLDKVVAAMGDRSPV